MTKTGSSRFMSMFLSVCMVFMCMVGMSVTASADETTVTITMSAQAFSNQQVITSITSGDVTIRAAKGNNNSLSPRYFTNGEAVRFYFGNSFTVTASENVITKIELSFGSGETNNAITVDTGELSGGTWTGSATSVKFTIGGSYGFRGIASVAVTYETTPSTTEWESGDCLVKLDGTTITVTKKEGSGDGKMADYTTNERAPWDSVIRQENTVQTIDIKEGVTYISAYAFYMHSAKTINIPSTVTHIGAYCLENGSNPIQHDVCFTRPTDEGSLQLGASAFHSVHTILKYSGEGRFVLFDGDKELEEGERIFPGEGKTLTWKIPEFSITATSENGTVAATVGDSTTAVTKAKVGDTVTLTVTPASGYAFKSITASTPKDSPESFSDLVALMGTTVFNGSGYNTGDSCICKVWNDKFVVYNNSSTNVAEATASNVTNFSASAGMIEGEIQCSFRCNDVWWTIFVENGKISYISVDNGNIFGGSGESNGELVPDEITLTTVTSGSKYTFTMPKKNVAVTAEFEESSHDHNFTYSASGATITATCSAADCPLTDSKAILTIAAPALTTYGGTGSAAATLTGLDTFNSATGKTIAVTDIKYVGRAGTTYVESATAPTSAGKYTAKITVEAKTASVDYEIAKADPAYTVPTGLTATYGQTLADVSLPAGWAWAAPSTSVGNTGDNTFKAGFTPTDTDNYNTVSNVDVTITVGKADQSAPVVSSNNETIDGKADGTITGVTTAMEYKSAAANEYTAVTGTTIANLPAGTYNVRYKETSNYNASPAADVVINTGSKITVQFDADGGTPEPDSQQYSYSQTVSAPAANPEKTGYIFLYWSADGTTEYDFSAPLISNITLKAVYQANSYTITFDTDGGSEVAAITQDCGTAVTAPADPTKTGYTFTGWDSDIPETMPAEDMTITAQWTINQYTMTFDDNGSHSEYVLDYGTNLTEYVPDIQWEGHTFMGWNPEVPETVPAKDMTFTAVWDTNTYTITFDTDGGSYVAPIVQDYGTKVIAPMNPVREGYAFIGWDTAIPAEMPAYDMTVRALWVATPTIGVPRVSSGTARVPSGTAQPEVTTGTVEEAQPKMWAVLNDDNSVTVSWEKIKNASSYILYVEKNGKTVKFTETKGTEVTLKKAKNGATYKFSLKFTRNGSTYSAPKGYKANLRVYYKPAVTATATKDGKILLKWNKVANADKYVIYRVNASGKLVKAGTTTKTAARIAAKSTDTGYVVRAYVNGKLTKVTKADIAAVTTE